MSLEGHPHTHIHARALETHNMQNSLRGLLSDEFQRPPAPIVPEKSTVLSKSFFFGFENH